MTVYAKTNHSELLVHYCSARIDLRGGEVRIAIAHTLPKLHVSRCKRLRNDLERNKAFL